MNKIFETIKEQVQIEQKYTRLILKNLCILEKDKLYADLKYPSLHKYLIKELGYTEAESTLRVNTVRLMLKSDQAKKLVIEGKLSLTNASELQKVQHQIKSPEQLETLIQQGSETSTRKFKDILNQDLQTERREVLVLKEYMLNKFDRMRKSHGDLSTLELIDILLEKELKSPHALQRVRKCTNPSSRAIPKSTKVQVYTGFCTNCGVQHSLEYDHKVKHSHGGTNLPSNIQMLCRSCNQRKEIISKQSGLFI